MFEPNQIKILIKRMKIVSLNQSTNNIFFKTVLTAKKPDFLKGNAQRFPLCLRLYEPYTILDNLPENAYEIIG